jgi:hypothetical protein
MTDHDVCPNEMNEPQHLDPSAIEPLLSGAGHEIAPRLAELIGDMRVAYATILPPASAELSALLGTTALVAAASPAPRRLEKMRSSLLAKIAGATAALLAATGGLAVAHALPGPVQNAVSDLGIGAPANHKSRATSTPDSTTTLGPTTTTVATNPTPTTANHGAVVSGVAHDHSITGCDHGAAVSNVASDGRSQDNAQRPSTATTHSASCSTSTTTTVESTTSATADINHGKHPRSTATSPPEPVAHAPSSNHAGRTNQGNGGG